MDEARKSKPTLRARADKVKSFRCKNLVAVIENPDDIGNVGAIIRNVNALGVEKAYVVTAKKILPETWEEMRSKPKLNAISASAIKWSFVKVFPDTTACMDHLDKKGFVSIVTSPHRKECKNAVLHEFDYTIYSKLAVWFGNERNGISTAAIERSALCVNIPMYGIVESLNLATSSGIVLYEIARQRRAFQLELKEKVAARKSGTAGSP
ncbi:tRNA (guanosine-2'-O-)-methyltransferase [Roseiarcus fermentans]|uniref:tRNA (Guanosine-2'-O-)-methyltransferase n=1 Tax=Roseiarcus fermentans TaxID=1473586 RepID=A0A366FQ81_9HYPH|nr:RNA methyltransferase [Roseiarcus fermentans]RBP15889.1 tRNA (guanosine-2'-O-)-methyltransferase [Roseiarcus fermentans]